METLDSETAVRNYVAAQLEHTIRAKRPELQVTFTESVDRPRRGPRRIYWRITLPQSEGSWPSDYLVEARLDESEFVIWFGYSSAGTLATHHMMRPAVHVRFEDLGFAAREFPEDLRGEFTLGEVLEGMLFRSSFYHPNVLALT
jgi:hypothetical protein